MCVFKWLSLRWPVFLCNPLQKMHHPKHLPSLPDESWWNNTFKQLLLWISLIHSPALLLTVPTYKHSVKRMKVSKIILIGAFNGCTNDHWCSSDAEITAINSGNMFLPNWWLMINDQWCTINQHWSTLFPMLPLTPSEVLTSSASTGTWYRAYPLAITPKPKQSRFLSVWEK